MTSLLRLTGSVALALLATGCATLNPPPPVDVLPTTPPPVAATPRPSGPATGSLFHAASYRPAFEDQRARMVGDQVVVLIREKLDASQKSNSTVNRKSGTEAGINALPFVGTAFTDKTKLGATNKNEFTGTGSTDSANTFTGDITTTVVEVLPNGHLVIAGDSRSASTRTWTCCASGIGGPAHPAARQPGTVHPGRQRPRAGAGAAHRARPRPWAGCRGPSTPSLRSDPIATPYGPPARLAPARRRRRGGALLRPGWGTGPARPTRADLYRLAEHSRDPRIRPGRLWPRPENFCRPAHRQGRPGQNAGSAAGGGPIAGPPRVHGAGTAGSHIERAVHW